MDKTKRTGPVASTIARPKSYRLLPVGPSHGAEYHDTRVEYFKVPEACALTGFTYEIQTNGQHYEHFFLDAFR